MKMLPGEAQSCPFWNLLTKATSKMAHWQQLYIEKAKRDRIYGRGMLSDICTHRSQQKKNQLFAWKSSYPPYLSWSA